VDKEKEITNLELNRRNEKLEVEWPGDVVVN